MTTQLAVKLPEDLLARIDDLVTKGLFKSRSAAIRRGLEALVAADDRRLIDEAFRNGVSESDEEVEDSYRLAIESITEEPWEKWW